MNQCAQCGKTFKSRGVTHGQRLFCSAKCHATALHVTANSVLPPELVAQEVHAVHAGKCPKCDGPGPVDLHTSHTIFSALVFSQYKSKPELCCAACGRSAQWKALLSSSLLGWWGFPWGIIMTPIQIGKNARGTKLPPDGGPSPALVDLVRRHLASQLLAQGPDSGAAPYR